VGTTRNVFDEQAQRWEGIINWVGAFGDRQMPGSEGGVVARAVHGGALVLLFGFQTLSSGFPMVALIAQNQNTSILGNACSRCHGACCRVSRVGRRSK
jgi:hypothetical protein